MAKNNNKVVFNAKVSMICSLLNITRPLDDEIDNWMLDHGYDLRGLVYNIIKPKEEKRCTMGDSVLNKVKSIKRGVDWDVFDLDGLGLLHIEKIDDSDNIKDDFEAKKYAIVDGIKIIPIKELPTLFNLCMNYYMKDENFLHTGRMTDYREWGWIDSQQNRDALKRFTNGMLMRLNIADLVLG